VGQIVIAGIDKTLQVLAETRNGAASDLLLPALDSTLSVVAEGAVVAILERQCSDGELELVRRWRNMSPRWHELISERSSRLHNAIRTAIVGKESKLCVSGCAALVDLGEFDLLPTLISVAEDTKHPCSTQAAETVLEVANKIYKLASEPRDYRAERRDPQLLIRNAAKTLEGSIKRFAQHKRAEILESFLQLASRDNSTLKSILQNPKEGRYDAVIDALTYNQRPGTIRLLLNFLDDPQAPESLLKIIRERIDTEFIVRLLAKVEKDLTPIALRNLLRLRDFAWLDDELLTLDELDAASIATVAKLCTQSGMNRHRVFSVLQELIARDEPSGRLAAVKSLADFKGGAADDLLREAMDDIDPAVRASALLECRQREIPGTMQRLVASLDSEHEVEARVGRDCLGEFNLNRFLTSFEKFDESNRVSTGALVRKIQKDAEEMLKVELQAPARTRRLRALEAAPYLDVLPEVLPEVMPLTEDEDHFIRAASATVLGYCDTQDARDALRKLLVDSSRQVQEAAEHALQKQLETPTEAPVLG